MRIRRTPEERRDAKVEKLFGQDAKYIGIGIKIGRRVREAALEASQSELERVYAAEIAKATQAERQKRLASLIEKLPVERRYDLLAQHFPDDEELRAVLIAQREREIENQRRHTIVSELAEHARLHRTVDLSRIPADMSIVARLYRAGYTNPAYYSPASLANDKYSHSRDLKLTSMGQRTFKVLEDASNSILGSVLPSFESLDVFQFGGAIHATADTELTREVTYGQPIGCLIGGEAQILKQKHNSQPLHLGQFSVQGVELFGANLDRSTPA
jgi:hypothetical protein